jgi:DNA-binding transcriptional regulator of glucitol operon
LNLSFKTMVSVIVSIVVLIMIITLAFSFTQYWVSYANATCPVVNQACITNSTNYVSSTSGMWHAIIMVLVIIVVIIVVVALAKWLMREFNI